MDIIILSPNADLTLSWQLRIENMGDDVACRPMRTAQQAMTHLQSHFADGLLLLPGPESRRMLTLLTTRAPLCPPCTLGENAPDGPLPAPEDVPAAIRACVLPALCRHHLPRAAEMATALLRQLGAPARLRAWDFLPEMAGLTVVHPPLLRDLQHGLYPLIAGQYGLTPAVVERRLRLWVESAWSRGDLAALERFFGATVDPEKGKPTNRAFLCGVSAWVTAAMERLL